MRYRDREGVLTLGSAEGPLPEAGGITVRFISPEGGERSAGLFYDGTCTEKKE